MCTYSASAHFSFNTAQMAEELFKEPYFLAILL